MVADDVIEALGIHQYWVFANGAVTRHLDRDELVRAYWMDPTVAQGIVVELRAADPDYGFAVELEFGVAHEPGFVDRVPSAPPNPAVDDVLDHLHGRVQKVLVFHPDKSIDELYRAACDLVGDEAVPCYSGLGFIEIAARLVTKATALDELCRDLGIDPSAVAAFGDNHNDVAMLEWAGRSYAMGNASADAKAAADEVIATSDDDGLAIVVEQLVAERLAHHP
jgi:hydroxymethylpyrimidine pyrophosphatase-like HAD family hydrolase